MRTSTLECMTQTPVRLSRATCCLYHWSSNPCNFVVFLWHYREGDPLYDSTLGFCEQSDCWSTWALPAIRRYMYCQQTFFCLYPISYIVPLSSLSSLPPFLLSCVLVCLSPAHTLPPSLPLSLPRLSWLKLSPYTLLPLTLGHDGSLRFWSMDSKTCIQEITAHRKRYDESIYNVACHLSKPYFASAGADGIAKVFVWRSVPL